MSKKLDFNGKVFGRLTVVRELPERSKSRGVLWECICNCGNSAIVASSSLRTGHTNSCGCYQRQRASEARTTHGLSEHPLYNIWSLMKDRCRHQNNDAYERYGGRGIVVCDRWLESFENFYNDVSDGYKKHLELDRIDNDGNYEPSNVRWVTRQQNAMNRGSKKDTSSKYKGVSWNKQKGKWTAQIGVCGKVKRLGAFTEEGDAVLAYNEAAKELFGEYANLNKIETN